MASNALVIDISHHQPDPIDWAKLKANGTAGVIMKCSQGTNYVDDKYKARIAAASAAGLFVAGYHFFTNVDPVKQMQWFVKNCGLAYGCRLAIDHEANTDGSKPSLDQLLQAVGWLLDNTGYEITIYSGNLIKEQLGNDYNGLLAANTSLWLAQYTSGTPSWPKATWPNYSLWQYSDKGAVAGIKGNVDVNKWNGSPDKLESWFYRPDVPEPMPPEPPPEDLPVIGMDFTVPPGVKFRITVNGQLVFE